MISSVLDDIKKILKRVVNIILGRNVWYKYYGKNNRIDYPNLSIFELIEKTSHSFPNYSAYEYYGKTVSYREFILKIKKCASALIELGVEKGDRVTICMPNTPSTIIMFYAINFVGATASMIHPLSSENEIEFYLKESNSKYILTLDLVYDKVMKVVEKTNIKKVIVSSISDNMGKFKRSVYWFFSGRKNKIQKSENSMLYSEFIKLGREYRDLTPVKVRKNDEAVILYSGGTTGKPKGVVLTNLNFNALAMQARISCNPAKAGDSILAILPNFHGFGLGVSIHTPLYIGMKVILIPNFNSRKFGSLIRKHRPNFITGVPTLYESLLKTSLGRHSLSNLTSVICGGDTLTPTLQDEVNDFLKRHGSKAKIRCGYGLTECTGASCLNPRGECRYNSIGIPFPDMEYKIVNVGTFDEAKINEGGEICISGPTVMKEYLNNEEETKSVLVKHSDGKVWLHTGDIGYMDDDGFIYFKQRLKRLIISSGYNIYPSYVEEIIKKHHAVENCAVVGMEHKYKKQVVKAYIVLKEQYKSSARVKRDLKKYCESNLVKYSWPYEYKYIDEIPTTLVGKVSYKDL